MTNNVVILGATSAIAEKTARCFAKDGAAFYLAGRSSEKLNSVANDLKVRGAADVQIGDLHLNSEGAIDALLADIKSGFETIDVLLIAYGSLPNQKRCEASVAESSNEFYLNCTSIILLLTNIAPIFEKQQHGTIAVISSVAGDRGRQSNYLYGAAKGAISIFLQGLRNRLDRKGVNVLTIKPGFVDTPMTTEFDKGILWASPDTVGNGIYRAILKRKDVVYLPWFWRWVMLVIKLIPEKIFKRLSL